MIDRNLLPLFVIGVHRSGTTWVANTLCNHSAISGIQSEKHFGIVESWFFSHIDLRFGEINNLERFRSLVDTFCRTEYFRSSNISIEEVYLFQQSSYADFFERFMILTSSAKPVSVYWLEKTPLHTLYLDKLLKYYPQARFITVKRSLEEVVLSSLKIAEKRNQFSTGKTKWSLIFRTIQHWYKYMAFINYYNRSYSKRFYNLKYNLLLQNPPKEFKQCLAYLCLPWEETVLEENFQRNTSYTTINNEEESNSLSYIRNFVRLVSKFTKYVPFKAYQLQELARKPRNREPVPFLSLEI